MTEHRLATRCLNGMPDRLGQNDIVLLTVLMVRASF